MIVNLAVLIYVILVLSALAKFYFYYNIRGSILMLTAIIPMLLVAVLPFLFIYHIARDKEIGMLVKLASSIRAFYDCIIDYPVNVGIAAFCLDPSHNSANIEKPCCNEVPKVEVDADTSMLSSFVESVGKILSCFCHAREVVEPYHR